MIGGVVLAAGASRRAKRIKALATLDGLTFVERAVETLRAGGCDEVVVVVGPPWADDVAAATDAARVDNPRPERGMLSSLQLALRDSWGAAVVALVDHPRVEPSTVSALIARWSRSGADLVSPRCDGRSGHPYLVSRAVFDALRAADPDQGARAVYAPLRREYVEVGDRGILDDLDTPEAIEALAGAATDPRTGA